MPNVENKALTEKRDSFLKYISDKTIVFAKDLSLLYNTLDTLFGKAETAFKDLNSALNHAKPNELFCDGDLIKKQLKEFSLVEIVNARITQE